MFVDLIEVEVEAGNGGNGLTSFRREKFVAQGGPDGGNGGNGGNVIFRADNNEASLAKFRQLKLIKAQAGGHGGSANKAGKTGQDKLVSVPVGTIVSEAPGEQILADLNQPDHQVIVAKGGAGGFGNAHFKSSVRRAPVVSEKGLPGDSKRLSLELKIVADVGLVGLPNAGKSTFLKAVSNARPKIADYPFTTLEPNLGVADVVNDSLLIADIPGLIEGAHLDKGLGHKFLKHIERTRVILHLIDCYHDQVDLAYKQIRQELQLYSDHLAGLPEIVGLTKTEGLPPEQLDSKLASLRSVIDSPQSQLTHISSHAGTNLDQILKLAIYQVKQARLSGLAGQEQAKGDEDRVVFKLAESPGSFRVTHHDDHFLVTGGKIEHFARKTRFDQESGRDRLRDIMQKLGISQELHKRNYDNQFIVFGDPEIGRLKLSDEL